MTAGHSRWFCCQLGAREHYSVPRALHLAGREVTLCTDAWAPPGSLWARLPGRVGRPLRERYHGDLADAKVRACNTALLRFELVQRCKGAAGWDLILARNRWFQERMMKPWAGAQAAPNQPPPILFSYSYTALAGFRWAKTHGWRTVLGQIDPGLEEERLVARVRQSHAELDPGWRPAPARYWEDWRAECELADVILVNSAFARRGLTAAGVPEGKMRVVPLAYAPPAAAASFARRYPRTFTPQRPLRVLFLGQVNLRKGAHFLLEAARELASQPVEWWLVGPVQIEVPADLRHHPAVRWFGAVPRGEVHRFYREADVFLFPTLSDGFGLTQLEALAWRLPVVASAHCGEVVRDGRNGLRLEEVTTAAVAGAVRRCLAEPSLLAGWAQNCELPSGGGLGNLAASLHDVICGCAWPASRGGMTHDE